MLAKDRSKTAVSPLTTYFENKQDRRSDTRDGSARPSTDVPHPMVSAQSSENFKVFHVQNIVTDNSMIVEEPR